MLPDLERPSFDRSSRPGNDLLREYAPLKAWELARREAARSPMGIYGTGAVLLSKNGQIIANGCAHPSADGQMVTTHAERHCLQRSLHEDLRDAVCLVYTESSRSGGCPWTSRPCLNCAKALVKRGVSAAIYPTRDRDTGLWMIEWDEMKDVMDYGKVIGSSEKRFARTLVR